MKTFAEVAEWCAGAAEQFGDPSGMLYGELTLLLGPALPLFPLPVGAGQYELNEFGELMAYGVVRVASDVWAIAPSLNAEGLIHAFIVLYGVPDPAPWERRIVLPDRSLATPS